MGNDHRDDIDMNGMGKDNEAERLEDYLEFERHLERLQQGKRPRRPRRMTRGQAKAYQMAALFRAAAPGNAEPDPEFAARLQSQLEGELRGRRRWFHSLLPAPKKARGVSRRALLTGGLSTAAGLAAGVVLGWGADHTVMAGEEQAAIWPNTPLVGLGKDWVAVGQAADIAPGAMLQFRTETLTGYVFHNDEADGDADKEPEWIAMSAACTHMGCIVAWNSQDRLLHCPCHDGAFTRYGAPSNSGKRYLRSLPRMEVQIRDGQVYVQVPAALSSDAPSTH
jgi:Rieske Fe-S protein